MISVSVSLYLSLRMPLALQASLLMSFSLTRSEVAVGRTAGAYLQAVGVRSKKGWCRHTMGRQQLVEMTGRLAEAEMGRRRHCGGMLTA